MKNFTLIKEILGAEYKKDSPFKFNQIQIYIINIERKNNIFWCMVYSRQVKIGRPWNVPPPKF